MNYLVKATEIRHLEALVEADSPDEAAEAFLSQEFDRLMIVSAEEPVVEEVVPCK